LADGLKFETNEWKNGGENDVQLNDSETGVKAVEQKERKKETRKGVPRRHLYIPQKLATL